MKFKLSKKQTILILSGALSMGMMGPQSVYGEDLGEAWNNSIKLNRKYYPSRNMTIYRGTMGPTVDRGKRKIKWLRSSVGVDVSQNSCGGIDFGAMFKLNFNKNAASEFVEDLKGSLMGLVGAAPMLLLEIIDPNLASFFKNLQTNSFLNMDTNMASCEKLYESVKGAGKEIFGPGRKSCIKEMTSDGGASFEDALSGCEGLEKIGKFLDNPAGLLTNVSDSIKGYLGKSMGDGFTPAYADFIESLVGVTEVSGKDGVILSTKLPRRPLNNIISEEKTKLYDDFQLVALAVAEGNVPPTASMDALSTDTTPMSVGVIEDMLDLPELVLEKRLDAYTTLVANRKIKEQILDIDKKLAALENRPDIKDFEQAKIFKMEKVRAGLEKEIVQMDKDIKEAGDQEKLIKLNSDDVERSLSEGVYRGENHGKDVDKVVKGVMGGFGGFKLREGSETL